MPNLLDGPLEVWTEPGQSAIYDFHLTPNTVESRKGMIVFSGREMRKENNPDYDSGKFDVMRSESSLTLTARKPDSYYKCHQRKVNTAENP